MLYSGVSVVVTWFKDHTWFLTVPPSPPSSFQLLEDSQRRGERELTERQEKAQIEIEKCRQRVDELSEYNDLNLITQYCKEVSQLQKRMGEIQDQIVQINKVHLHCTTVPVSVCLSVCLSGRDGRVSSIGATAQCRLVPGIGVQQQHEAYKYMCTCSIIVD